MCGIGGFVDYERDARRGGPILHGMKRTLTPRGPDAEGTYFDEDAAFIHRRLIVIDPEGGKQPMCSPDRNTILIYNGELYNTPELRTELMSRGHEFVGHSDTEVLLHAYLEWKTDAFARLNGIFAFAIWEKRERRLTLCRDRLGVKPLFFAPIRNGLTFGSTIDTVLCHPEIEPALDRGWSAHAAAARAGSPAGIRCFSADFLTCARAFCGSYAGSFHRSHLLEARGARA